MKNNKNKIMREEIRNEVIAARILAKTVDEATDKILSLLGENTEGVSTSSCTESGVSHGVSDRNASRSESTNVPEEGVGGTLALRTETKEDCKCVASCLLKRHGFTSYFEGREYNCKQSG